MGLMGYGKIEGEHMRTDLYSHLSDNDIQIITEMFDEMDSWPYVQIQIEIREKLRRMFLRYSTLDAPTRERLEQLVFKHKQYCSKSGNTSYMRQHNTFVLHYINGISFKKIYREQGIALRTTCKDATAVLDRMMISLLGFYGIRWDKHS